MSRSLSTRDIALIAMGVALTAVCSWISIPLTVPFTMQTFAVCLVTALFGLRQGMWTVVCYILLGAAGAPVFSGFSVGFRFTALIVGLASEKLGQRLPVLAAAMAAGILVCYAFGTAWFMFVYARKSGPIGLGTALAWCVLPYLLPDAVKIALASVLVQRLRPIMGREVCTV